jgi:hypothetical protein
LLCLVFWLPTLFFFVRVCFLLFHILRKFAYFRLTFFPVWVAPFEKKRKRFSLDVILAVEISRN